MASTVGDAKRLVPVIEQDGSTYSGFHQGAGETTVAELLEADIPKYSLVLIDEIESSLHPRAQRRLIRDLAERCRELQLQIILTTHSPYVLEELPETARAQILSSFGAKKIIYGVSPAFAMTKMDDVKQSECDVYVEDPRAATLLVEILTKFGPELVERCSVTPCGAVSVGQSLGIMASENRFRIPTCVFLDGDAGPTAGCGVLPGGDAPERVIFDGLQAIGWAGVSERVARDYPSLVDACSRARTLGDHHDWIRQAAVSLTLGGDILWQAMCSAWVDQCCDPSEGRVIAQRVQDALQGIDPVAPSLPPVVASDSPTLQSSDAESQDQLRVADGLFAPVTSDQ